MKNDFDEEMIKYWFMFKGLALKVFITEVRNLRQWKTVEMKRMCLFVNSCLPSMILKYKISFLSSLSVTF